MSDAIPRDPSPLLGEQPKAAEPGSSPRLTRLANVWKALAAETGSELFHRAVFSAATEEAAGDYEQILALGRQNFVTGLGRWAAASAAEGWWQSLELETIDFQAHRATVRVGQPWEGSPGFAQADCPHLCGQLAGIFSLAFGIPCSARAEAAPQPQAIRVFLRPAERMPAEELAAAREHQRSVRELELSSAVEQANADLREARRQLEDANRTLEQRVFERTRELQGAKGDLEKALRETAKLNEFSRKLNEERDVAGVIRQILTHLIFSFDTDGVWLLSIDQDTGELFTKGSSYAFAMQLPEATSQWLNNFREPVTRETGSIYFAVQNKRPLQISQISTHRHHGSELEERLINELGVTGCIQVPLLADTGVIAVLLLFWVRQGGAHIANNDSERLHRYCDQLKGALHNSNLMARLEAEREQSEKLLRNVLPVTVAEELKQSGYVEPLAYESTSILFTDFVGFTTIAETMSPIELVKELDGCFTQFDEIIARHRLEKLKTIGDAYMCCGGLPGINRTHAIDAVLAALEFRDFMQQMATVKESAGEEFWQLRIGIHTGPVMAGVVGKNKFAYDIWGDAVNTASRMESSGEPGQVNISGEVYAQVRFFFKCKHRGPVEARGKGEVDMYFVERIRRQFSRDAEGRVPNDAFHRAYELVAAGKRLRFRQPK